MIYFNYQIHSYIDLLIPINLMIPSIITQANQRHS